MRSDSDLHNNMKLMVIGIYVALWSTASAKVSYYGFQMYEIVPKNSLHLQILHEMHVDSKTEVIDFWVPPRGVNIPVQISLPPQSKFAATFQLIGMGVELVMQDVQQYIDIQNGVDLLLIPKGKTQGFNYAKYHNLSTINDWITNITTVYSSITEVIEVGTSYEGRIIRLIKINTVKDQKKHGFFMEGGIHAREWITPATVIYLTGQMLDMYGKDPNITDLVDSFTWYILPVFNVDGYEYTWTTDRNWRKTRSKQGSCYGADPNRNWDWEWCKEGASKDPCSNNYCGPSAFSEAEVKAVADYISMQNGTIKAFIDFHSYLQLWMTPWGYTKNLPPDYANQDSGAKAACDALEVDYGTKYQHGSIANALYLASGCSVDWTYGAEKIKYSYGVELRDTGKYGFLLPADQIVPSGKETLKALRALCEKINVCPEGLYKCGSGQCIQALICDGTIHCADGTDESNCETRVSNIVPGSYSNYSNNDSVILTSPLLSTLATTQKNYIHNKIDEKDVIITVVIISTLLISLVVIVTLVYRKRKNSQTNSYYSNQGFSESDI